MVLTAVEITTSTVWNRWVAFVIPSGFIMTDHNHVRRGCHYHVRRGPVRLLWVGGSTLSWALEHWIGSIPHGTGPLDRLALPHWCGHWGGVITNTVQDRGARCWSSVVPPLYLSMSRWFDHELPQPRPPWLWLPPFKFGGSHSWGSGRCLPRV